MLHSGTSIWTPEEKRNLLFSFELCKVRIILDPIKGRLILLLFSFELCMGETRLHRVEHDAAKPQLAIFFWIMLRKWGLANSDLARHRIACYFLLNYAKRFVECIAKEFGVSVLLFSFELCFPDNCREGRTTVACYLLFSFELCLWRL